MQLAFDFTCRFEVRCSRMTWREGEIVQVVESGPYCVDLTWTWLR